MAKEKKYLTVEVFEKFKSNDFHHLKLDVLANKRLLWIILGGLIIATAIERFAN